MLEDVLEQAEAAKVNFENMVRFNPASGQSTYLKIAMGYLNEAIQMMEADILDGD